MTNRVHPTLTGYVHEEGSFRVNSACVIGNVEVIDKRTGEVRYLNPGFSLLDWLISVCVIIAFPDPIRK